ncbi:MAG: hypothetical protein ABF306_16630 [Nocardioides marinisabuli]|uniref:hypothetical protein n=1 Tax=Nocardioides marinisabuli TaxID=419476 RepID=UPI003219954E
MRPEQRRPGQSNADFEGRDRASRGVTGSFLGTSSLHGGGDPSWALRLWRALFAWRDERRARPGA